MDFSGLFELSLKMLSHFCLKVVFLVTIASKKQKQMDDKSAARDDPSSIFDRYVVKFCPTVVLQKIFILWSLWRPDLRRPNKTQKIFFVWIKMVETLWYLNWFYTMYLPTRSWTKIFVIALSNEGRFGEAICWPFLTWDSLIK